MKALTAEWVGKAEGDLHSCLREVRARRHHNPDSACFHAQTPPMGISFLCLIASALLLAGCASTPSKNVVVRHCG